MKPDYASNTPAENKDRWQTPIEVFAALDLEFGFWLDAAADDKNALCARYLTAADNALATEWESCGAIFCNPPYSNIRPWVIKAAEQCQKQRQPVVMLLPADTSTGWFATALQTVDEVRLVTEGRIGFINASTGLPGKNGAGKGNIFLIWRPFTNPRRQFTTVTRSRLLSMGK